MIIVYYSNILIILTPSLSMRECESLFLSKTLGVRILESWKVPSRHAFGSWNPKLELELLNLMDV